MVNSKHIPVPYTPLFASVKMLDIGLTTTYFFIAGLFAAKISDYIFSFIETDDMTQWQTCSLTYFTLNIVFHLFYIGILAYILRNIVGLIPYPLDGIGGYQHARLKELGGGVILVIALYLFQTHLEQKMIIYGNRIMGIAIQDPITAEIGSKSAPVS